MNEQIIQESEALKPHFDSLQKRFLVIGLLGIALAIAGQFIIPKTSLSLTCSRLFSGSVFPWEAWPSL